MVKYDGVIIIKGGIDHAMSILFKEYGIATNADLIEMKKCTNTLTR